MTIEPYQYEVKVTISWHIRLDSYSPPEDVEAEVEDTVKGLLPEARWGEIAGEDIEIEVEQR